MPSGKGRVHSVSGPHNDKCEYQMLIYHIFYYVQIEASMQHCQKSDSEQRFSDLWHIATNPRTDNWNKTSCKLTFLYSSNVARTCALLLLARIALKVSSFGSMDIWPSYRKNIPELWQLQIALWIMNTLHLSEQHISKMINAFAFTACFAWCCVLGSMNGMMIKYPDFWSHKGMNQVLIYLFFVTDSRL